MATTLRRKITISNANIDAPLSNFPVYVRLRSTNFNFAQSTAAGNDIRFTAVDGVTQLSFERERHDQGAQVADYIVRIPTVSNIVATEFFIHFSTDTAILDGATPTAVWDNNTAARYSLRENPAGAAPQIRDSTVNAQHGTTSGAMTSGQSIEGQVGRALNFDGNDRVEFPGGLNSHFTISGWVRLPNFSAKTHNTFYDITPHTVLTISLNRTTPNGNINVFIGNGSTWFAAPSIVSSGNLTQNVWNHLAVICNGTSTVLYLDGVMRGFSTHVPSGGGAWWRMGALAHVSAREYLSGHLDEFVISNTARSAAWVKASFHSGNNSLLTVGAVEGATFFLSLTTGIRVSGNMTKQIFKTLVASVQTTTEVRKQIFKTLVARTITLTTLIRRIVEILLPGAPSIILRSSKEKVLRPPKERRVNMQFGSFSKQSRDETTIQLDGSVYREIQAGEIFVSAIVEVRLDNELVEGIYVSHEVVDGKNINIRVKGGISGQRYKITVLAVTDSAHLREADLIMYVNDRD